MNKPKLILAGGAGFLGRALSRHFVTAGYEVIILTRRARQSCDGVTYLQWDAATMGAWCAVLEGAHAVVNLTGRSVDCRYTAKNKEVILQSRLKSTAILGQCMNACECPPKFWINAASATIYADTRGDLPANTEDDGQIGAGFSVDVCCAWEAEFERHELAKTQKFCLRVAITLGADGGALIPLRNLARLGLGGQQGGGDQFMSWLHIDDFVGIVAAILRGDFEPNVYNCAAPYPVRNDAFMQSLRGVVGRRFGLRLPSWLLAIGAILIRTEIELVLKSRKVVPARLLAAGYRFKYPEINAALHALEEDGTGGSE